MYRIVDQRTKTFSLKLLRPKGPVYNSPVQRTGKRILRPPQALKGRNNSRLRFIPPFQGLILLCFHLSRALPAWLRRQTGPSLLHFSLSGKEPF